ncbi:MAG TPA: hypothetical protein VGH59_04940 [Casimicrobiaceae bacterium]|jgi:hypothetical protein
MEKFSPEFNALWRAEQDAKDARDAAAKDDALSSQEVALEELAERVNAARSIA